MGCPGRSHVGEGSELVQEEMSVAPSMRVMLGVGTSAPPSMAFLRDRRVGKMASLAPRGKNWLEEEEWRARARSAGPARPRMYLFLSSSAVLRVSWCSILLQHRKGEGGTVTHL